MVSMAKMAVSQAASSPPRSGGDAEALTRMASDMEQISYAASHDLMAPPRIILSCCETLKAKLGTLSDPAAREAFEILNSEAAHMKAMLQGMIDYLHLETFTPQTTALESADLLKAAMLQLGEKIRAAGASVTQDNLPRVQGHRGRLTRLFFCLLDNAVKFRSDAPPQIHVSARRMENLWEFCVKDNGLGIEPEHLGMIFYLYQRLHTPEKYEGNGMGLPLSRKIVESHGGSLRVESKPGEGSRFYFTLPAATE